MNFSRTVLKLQMREIVRKMARMKYVKFWIIMLHFTKVASLEANKQPGSATRTCHQSTEFMCAEDPLDCIPKDKICNGISECKNAADESVQICGCLPNEFQCNATSCIDVIKRCDRQGDCQDAEDELNCETYICPDTHTKCSNHYCVPLSAACNYVDDCGDNSDEDNCEYRDCYGTEFRCRDQQCIPNGHLCDEVANCPDGSDEENCEEHFQCPSGFYIHKDTYCDGWPECYDSHADELNCRNCTQDEFQCTNGRCIRNSNVCDGFCDCIYGCEDERDCGSIECPVGEYYMCRNENRCIAKQYICDGINDCYNSANGSDEYYCYKEDRSWCEKQKDLWGEVIYCPEGRCLPADGIDSVLCDHYADCLNGEDEMNCEYKSCNSSQFQCENGQCISWDKRCDGGIDCYDRTDEIHCEEHSCPYGKTRCNAGQCITDSYVCDFIRDCPDFSDEENCERRNCKPDEFRCDSGQCISKEYVCYNGKNVGRHGCADKSHLADCGNFTCKQGQYKCYRSYCIDESQVCDKQSIDCVHTADDEGDCGYRCPHPELVCECDDVLMDCENLGLLSLPYDLSREELTKFKLGGNFINITEKMFEWMSQLVYLDLNNNRIRFIPEGAFRSLFRLQSLNLENNEITQIGNGTFQGLTDLRTLVLHGNKIRSIAPQGFLGLSHLHALNLSYQDLRRLESNTFKGLHNIRNLNLSHNHITAIEEGAFNGLFELLSLDISHNRVFKITENIFHGLRKLRFLDISYNSIAILEESAFDSLEDLDHLLTDEFRFCCAARISGVCLPEPDEFSSCTDLMSNYVLRVSIWILGLVAFFGNLLVVIWRSRDLRKGKVHSFLITNLAIGDFFMGIYLLIIAVVDSYYRGSYILYDIFWRQSDLCKFAGFISTFSSELSVLTLTIITIDRLICIIFPLHLRRLKLKDAFYVMLFIWFTVFIIATFPLLGLDYFENFYGRSGVCLAFHITNYKPKGWEYSVGVFLVLNFMSFLVIFFSYLRMFFVAKQTRSAVRKSQDKNDIAMAKRMTLIVMTDFFCWVPIILLGFASLGGAEIPTEVYAWVAVFVLPLNSAINPVIYTLSTAPFIRNIRKRVFTFRKSFSASKTDTKHSFLDDRSSHAWDRKPIYRQLELMRMRSYNDKSYSSSHSSHSHNDNILMGVARPKNTNVIHVDTTYD